MHLYLCIGVTVYLGSVIKRYFELIQDLCIQHSLGATFPIRIATKLLLNFMLQSVMGRLSDLPKPRRETIHF